MNVIDLSQPELAALETVIQNCLHTVGMAELSRFQVHALQRAGTVYILEYEGVLLEPGMELLSPTVISLFKRLKANGVLVYILTEQVRFVISEALGEDVFTGIVTCANRESKAAMVGLIRESYHGSLVVCCGTTFLPLVGSLGSRDFVYNVYEADPRRRVRAYNMRTLFDTRLPIYPVPRTFVVDLMMLVMVKSMLRSRLCHSVNAQSPNL